MRQSWRVYGCGLAGTFTPSARSGPSSRSPSAYTPQTNGTAVDVGPATVPFTSQAPLPKRLAELSYVSVSACVASRFATSDSHRAMASDERSGPGVFPPQATVAKSVAMSGMDRRVMWATVGLATAAVVTG